MADKPWSGQADSVDLKLTDEILLLRAGTNPKAKGSYIVTLFNNNLDDVKVKTSYESNNNTNAFTDTEKTNLGNQSGTNTGDMSDGDVKIAYENNVNTNVFTDVEKTNLGNQSGTNTGDMSDANVKTAYENNVNTNVFTDTEKTRLAGIEAGAEVNTVNDVFGRTGNVVAIASDYAASQIDNDSDVAGDFVDDALNVLSNDSFEIQNAVLLAEEDISADNDEAAGIYFSLDGFKMYTCRFGNNDLPHVDEYTLSKPWDPSTKTKINTFDPTGPMGVTPRASGVALNEDLTRLYVNEQQTNGEGKVHEWTLGTPGNISTTTFSTTLDMGSDIGVGASGRDITLGKNDTRLYVTLGDGIILQYNLSSAGVLGTASFSKSKDLSAQTSSASDFVFNTNGSKAFFSDVTISRKLFQFTASTFWEIDSLTFDSIEFDPSVSVSQHSSTFFRTHGSILFIIDGVDGEISSFAIRQGGDNQFLDDEKTKLANIADNAIANLVEDITPQLGGDLDLNGNVISGLEIGTDVQAHSAVLDGTTASFLTADGTKLDNIEPAADVTDTGNVTAAGALMDSEVDADLKTFALPANTTITVFGASLLDDADASAARDTLELIIGTDVQAFDADTAKLDVAQEYTATQNFNATSLTALGADLVTNGAFAADTDWAKGTGWTIAAGVASSDGTQSADADLTQALFLVSGKTYEVEFTVSNYSAGNVTPVAGDVEGTDHAANGTFIENIIAGAGGDIDIRADLNFIGDIDDVIVRLANVSWDLSVNQVTKITLDGDVVIDNPTSLIDGATYILTVTQDATGTRLITWGSVFKWPGSTPPTLSTGVNDVDIITFISDGTNMYGVFQGDFS